MGEPHLYRQKFGVLLADILACLAAFAVAMHLRFNADLGWFDPGHPPWGPMLNALPVVLAVWLVTLRGCGLYQLDRLGLGEEIARLLQSLIVLLGILLSITFFYRGFSYSRGFTLLFVPLLVGFTFLGRLSLRLVLRKLMSMGSVGRRVLLVGRSPVAEHLSKIAISADSPLEVAGVLDDEEVAGTVVGGTTVLGGTVDLEKVARSTNARGIIITTSKLNEAAQLALLDTCLALDLEWEVVPSVYELMLDRVRFDMVGGVPVLGLKRPNIRGVNRILKRAFDIAVSSAMLLLLSPLMALVALAVKLGSKGPVFFKQTRVGEGGRPFEFIKFRSMRVDADDGDHRKYTKEWIENGKAACDGDDGEKVYKIKHDPRVTKLGTFIRKYSIDELPQLLNVLRGDMSLIGPRPPIPYEVEVYREWHRRRLEGPQGITGLWQVSGRNRLSFDEMVKLDIEYIENWSISLDIKILLRTVGVVLFDRAY